MSSAKKLSQDRVVPRLVQPVRSRLVCVRVNFTEQLSTIDQQLINDEVKLTEQKQDAERVRLIMERFRAADEQILITNEAQEQAQKELKEPMSCLEEANRALLLLESSWESARRLLLGDANFVQKLQFNKDAVSAATLTKLESEFLSDERFRREEVERQSVAAASMVGWVRAIHQYATSRHKVQPTLDKLDKAQGRLQLIMREFQVSRDRAGDADAAWQATQAAIDTASTRKDALRSEMTSLSARCDSGQLAVEALTEDRELQREAANAISMRRGFSLTTWNALLSAGALTYACELSALSVREQVFQAWGAAYCCYGGLTPGCPPTSTCCTFVPSISVVLKEGDALTETPLSGLFNGEYLPDGGCIDETTKLVTSVGDLIFSRRRLWDASLLSLVALTSSLPAVMITRFSSEMEQLLVSCARRVWHWPQLHMVHARARDFDDVFKVAARSGHQLVVLDVEPHDAQPLNEENECLAAALTGASSVSD
ncbi:Microtubule-binding stalk of dynein motor domain-containing protein, partial [Phytophthora infestans]